MPGASIIQNSRGAPTSPMMAFESTELSAPGTTIFGHGNATDLQLVTLNSSGNPGPSFQIWKLTAPTVSASIATVTHPANAAGLALWYNASCPNGFIFNWIAGVGDITLTFREGLGPA